MAPFLFALPINFLAVLVCSLSGLVVICRAPEKGIQPETGRESWETLIFGVHHV